MITRPYLVSMASYNSWMNGKVYDAAARLSDGRTLRRAKRADGNRRDKSVDLPKSPVIIVGSPRAFP